MRGKNMNQEQWNKISKLLEKINQEIDDQRLSLGLDDFYINELLPMLVDEIVTKNLDDESTLVNIVKHPDFYKYIEEKYLALNFENCEKRLKIIREIFGLIHKGYYAGAIVLLYGQFEGLLTDFLIDQMLIIQYESGDLKYEKSPFKFTKRDGEEKTFKRKKIIGLFDKILIAQHYYNEFYELKIYEIDEEGTSISDSRNRILHGTDLDNFNLERVFILAMGFHKVCKVILEIKN